MKYPTRAGWKGRLPGLVLAAEAMAGPDFDTREEEALGQALAVHFNWDSTAILETLIAALKDVSCHHLAGQIKGGP